MNDYNKEDYLQDRQSAMTRLMHVSPENSLNKAYDEGYKRGVLDTHMRFTVSAQNALIALRRLPDHADRLHVDDPHIDWGHPGGDKTVESVVTGSGFSMKMVSMDPHTLKRIEDSFKTRVSEQSKKMAELFKEEK